MTEHPTDALKPCPFCGHAEALEIVPLQAGSKMFRLVHCNGCGAEGPLDDSDPVRAWNTRMEAAKPSTDFVGYYNDEAPNEAVIDTTPIDDEGLRQQIAKMEQREELVREALFVLSDRLRKIGALDSDNVHEAYEKVVAAINVS